MSSFESIEDSQESNEAPPAGPPAAPQADKPQASELQPPKKVAFAGGDDDDDDGLAMSFNTQTGLARAHGFHPQHPQPNLGPPAAQYAQASNMLSPELQLANLRRDDATAQMWFANSIRDLELDVAECAAIKAKVEAAEIATIEAKFGATVTSTTSIAP